MSEIPKNLDFEKEFEEIDWKNNLLFANLSSQMDEHVSLEEHLSNQDLQERANIREVKLVRDYGKSDDKEGFVGNVEAQVKEKETDPESPISTEEHTANKAFLNWARRIN